MKNGINTSQFIEDYLDGLNSCINAIDQKEIEKVIQHLIKLKKRQGRLFLLGVGGSAANCAHAVNDFRKICGIETYTPTDNVAELTARINDEGWHGIFASWLKGCKLSDNDAVMVFSVGGGSIEKNISMNIVIALMYAQEAGATILGIVGRDGGYTKKIATASILVPTIADQTITPYAETLQAVLWHAFVNHPQLRT